MSGKTLLLAGPNVWQENKLSATLLMFLDFINTLIEDYCISLVSLFSLIHGGIDSVIMHFRCKLCTSKTTLKQIANIKEFLSLYL